MICRSLCLFVVVLLVGCTAPPPPPYRPPPVFTLKPATLPFATSKLFYDLRGRKVALGSDTFWMFSPGDKLRVDLVSFDLDADTCRVVVYVETTKDGKRYLMGGLRMIYERRFGGWYLVGVQRTIQLRIREQAQ